MHVVFIHAYLLKFHLVALFDFFANPKKCLLSVLSAKYRFAILNRKNKVVVDLVGCVLTFMDRSHPLFIRYKVTARQAARNKASLIKSPKAGNKPPLIAAEKKPDGTVEVKFWDERFHATFGRRGETTSRRFGASVAVKGGRVIESRF